MKSITLINVQFGPYKEYFPLFVNSCKNNPSIRFLLVTDQILDSTPPNVIVRRTSFYDCKQRIQNLFDFPINLSSGYDLCDYKVAYGEIFQEELCDADFWGYCDTDLIFGNIRKFITDDILDRYDKILIRGHFTLFRNNLYINSIYRKRLADGTNQYKKVFMDGGIHHFDEGMPGATKGINTLFSENIGWNRVYDKYLFMDLCVDSYAFINADFKESRKELEKASHSFFYYDNGKLYRCLMDGSLEEFMYIHFQKRNMQMGKLNAKSQQYYIIPNRFVAVNDITMAQLYRANNKRIYWSRIFSQTKRRLKRGLRRIFE